MSSPFDRKTDIAVEAESAPSSSSQRTSGTAIVRALRRQGDEAQFTQVIAAIAAVEDGFGRGLVDLLLRTAANGKSGGRARAFAEDGVPDEIVCRAEQHLFDPDGSLGRIDLRFDGPGFTLLLENKLHSGYGSNQLSRYAAAARAQSAPRAGLLAVTRNVPTYGESALSDEPGWLGSVRWSRLMRAGLADLPIQDSKLKEQWQALLEVMEEDGDLGTTKADTELIQSWARYVQARSHLEDILGQVWEPLLEIMRTSLKSSHRVRLPAQRLVAPEHRGQRDQIIVQRTQQWVYVAFCVPENVKDPQVWVGFNASRGEANFEIGVSPWDAPARLEKKERQLQQAIDHLRQHGFLPDGDYWTHSFSPAEYLDADDVPAHLLELMTPAVEAISESRVLAGDIKLTVNRGKNGPPRRRVRTRV